MNEDELPEDDFNLLQLMLGALREVLSVATWLAKGGHIPPYQG